MTSLLNCKIENRILKIELNRLDKMNALSFELFQELEKVFDSLEGKSIMGAYIASNHSKAFCAGADIKAMNAMSPDEGKEFARYAQKVLNKIESSPIPVIAAVDGIALGGGCELAMACDFIFATENAKFGQPEVSLGLIPCFGGCLRLPKYIGKAKAKELIYTGKIIVANEAKEFGLVNKVVKDKKELEKAVLATFQDMKMKSKNAISLCKEVLNCLDLEDNQVLEQEAKLFKKSFNHEDKKIGIGAFLKKEKPKFLEA